MFDEAEFAGEASFDKASFTGEAGFVRAAFARDVVQRGVVRSADRGREKIIDTAELVSIAAAAA